MKTIGLWAAMILPLWDIPLIVRVIKRKSSSDISKVWAIGIWVCSALMTPSAFISGDIRAIGFNTVNLLMMTVVLIVVIKYHKAPS